jgi:hypothetical protein
MPAQLRPTTPTVPNGYRRLEGSERFAPVGSKGLGPADPKEKVPSSVYVRRPVEPPPLPVQAYWAATPLGQRKFLSHGELAQICGAAARRGCRRAQRDHPAERRAPTVHLPLDRPDHAPGEMLVPGLSALS